MSRQTRCFACGLAAACLAAPAFAQSAVSVVMRSGSGNAERTLAEGQGAQGWNSQTICATGAEASYGLIFGSAPGVGAGKTSWGEFRTVKNDAGGDEPEWNVESGYAAARGWRPRIRTSVVVVATESSEVLVEIDSNLSLHRVYLNEGAKPAKVTALGDNSKHTLHVGEFIEVHAGSGKVRRGPMAFDSDAAEFVQRAVGQQRFKQLNEKGCATSSPAP